MKNFVHAFFKSLPYKNALGIFVIVLMNPTISFGSQGNLPIYVNDKFLSLNPDSLFEDTIQYVTGDTLDVLADGLDTIYVLYSDTSLSANDSIEFRTANSDIDIGVTLGSVAKAIEHGQYGFGIEGFFTENHFSSNSTINTEGWQWLSDLYPQTIRFPGGANGKFMHLLPYRDMNYDEVLDPVSGYGYDIEEIIRFYDVTDDELMSEQTTNIDGAVYIVTPELIIEDLSDLDDIPPHTCNTCSDWMLSDYTPNLERFYKLWLNDQSVAPGPNQMYIDQFISMINEMQDQNDYVIDVIIDLNIVTETAPQCKAIV